MTGGAGGSTTGFPDAFVVSRAPGKAGRVLLKFPRGPFAFGSVEIVAEGGARVARFVNEDGLHTAVEILPEIAEPLRTLVIACACSLVDDRWLRAPQQTH